MLKNISQHELVATLVVSLSAMLVGYIQAYTGNGKPILRNNEFVPDQENIISLKIMIPVMSILSTIFGGFLIDKYGRQKIIYLQSYGFFIGLAILAEATTLLRVLIGRFIVGICIGIPIYLAEILHTPSRGTLGILPIIFSELAKTIFHILNKYETEWYVKAYIPCILCPISLVSLIFVPDSPRWYIVHEKEAQKAEYALIWLRSGFIDAQNEFREIIAMNNANTNFSFLSGLFKIINKTFIAIAVILLQQILSMFHYKIFTGMSLNNHLLMNSTIGIIGSIICMIFIDIIGRKALLINSSIFSSIFVIIILIIHYNFEFNYHSLSTKFIIIAYILYNLSLSTGLIPIPFILMSEMLPQKYRCLSCSLTVLTYFCCEFFIKNNLLYPINSEINIGFTIGIVLYTLIGCLGSSLIMLYVPETMNKSLEEIEIETMLAKI